MRTNIHISIILSIIVGLLCLYGCRLHRNAEVVPGFYNNPDLSNARSGRNGWQFDEIVSSLHNGLVKEVNDTTTDSIRRFKATMQKNRYYGYGGPSDSMFGFTLPYSRTDSEKAGTSFAKKWCESYRPSYFGEI